MNQYDPSPKTSFWLDQKPLILASTRTIRSDILRDANIPHTTQSADCDERAIENLMPDASHTAVAQSLAQAKSSLVSQANRDAITLGCDQVLVFDNKRLHKAKSLEEAREKLQKMRGKPHTLISAYCITKNGETLAQGNEDAELTMRDFSDAFLERYLTSEAGILQSVGCYKIEGLGLHLFSTIRGNHTTILGLPLQSVLADFRRLGHVLQ